MSRRQTSIGYSVYDILTRMIPGAVILAPGAATAVLYTNSVPQKITTPLILAVGLILLIFGESVVVIRSGIRVPPPFLEEVYKSAERDDALDAFMRFELWVTRKIPKLTPSARVNKESVTISERLDFDFRQLAESELDVDFDTHSAEDIYHYLSIYLDSGLSKRTRRYRSLYVFISNLQASTIISVSIYFITLLAAGIVEILPVGSVDLFPFTVAAFLSLFFSTGTLVILQLFSGVSDLYVTSLLREFRMQNLSSESSDNQ